MVEGYNYDEINLKINHFCGFDPNELHGYKKNFIIAGRFLEDILINNNLNHLDFYVFNEAGFHTLKHKFDYSLKERSHDNISYYIGTNHISIENPDYKFYINLYNAFGMEINDVLEKFPMPTNRCYYDIGKIVFYSGTKELIEKKELPINPNNVCTCLIMNAIHSGYSFNQNFYSKLPIKVIEEHHCYSRHCDCDEEEEQEYINYIDCKTDKIISENYYKMPDYKVVEYEQWIKDRNSGRKYDYTIIIKGYHIDPFLKVIMKNSIKDYNKCIYCDSYAFDMDGISLNPYYKSQYDVKPIPPQQTQTTKPAQSNTEPPTPKPIRYVYRRFVITDEKTKPIIDKLYEKYGIKETFDYGNQNKQKTNLQLNGKDMESIDEVKNLLDTIFNHVSNGGNREDIKKIDTSYSNFISDLYGKGILFYLAKVQKIKENPEPFTNFKGKQIKTITQLAEFIAEYKFIITNKLYTYTIGSFIGTLIGKFIDLAHNDGLIIPWLCLIKLFPDLVCDEYYPSYNTEKPENFHLSFEEVNETNSFDQELDIYKKYYDDKKEYEYKPIQ